MSNFTTETSEPPLRIELRSPGLEDLAARSSAGSRSSGSRDRTCDFLINSQAALPLAYPGMELVRGIEPPTNALQMRCSAN